MRCEPGDICIVVADVPGCEANIGAQLRVVRLMPFVDVNAWEFEDASRPLKMVPEDGEGGEYWTRSTAEGIGDGRYGGFLDRHLIPVGGPRFAAQVLQSEPTALEAVPA